MATQVLISTSGLAARRGCSRQNIARLVREGKLEPYAVLDNGAFVFTEDQAEPESGKQ